jgi:hypothetical protein
MAHHQAVRLAAVLVHDDDVGVAARAAGLNQLAHNLAQRRAAFVSGTCE